jgi:hypothetical protein
VPTFNDLRPCLLPINCQLSFFFRLDFSFPMFLLPLMLPQSSCVAAAAVVVVAVAVAQHCPRRSNCDNWPFPSSAGDRETDRSVLPRQMFPDVACNHTTLISLQSFTSTFAVASSSTSAAFGQTTEGCFLNATRPTTLDDYYGQQ